MNEKQFHVECERERREKVWVLSEVVAAARNEHVENVQHKKQIYKCCVYKIFPALLWWFSWEQFIFNSRFLSRTAFSACFWHSHFKREKWFSIVSRERFSYFPRRLRMAIYLCYHHTTTCEFIIFFS